MRTLTGVLVIALALATPLSAQRRSFLRWIVQLEDADALSDPRTFRTYDAAREITLKISMANESNDALTFDHSVLTNAVDFRVIQNGPVNVDVEWHPEAWFNGSRGVVSRTDRIQLEADSGVEWRVTLSRSGGSVFPPGEYEIQISWARLLPLLTTSTGQPWRGRAVPGTTVGLSIIPPRDQRECAAGYRRDGTRAARENRHVDARRAFELALTADPGDIAAQIGLGDALLSLNRYREAIGPFEAASGAARAKGERSPVTARLALAYLSAGDEQNARRVLQEAGASGALLTEQLQRLREQVVRRR
jgi:hypothetical protein